MKKLLFILAIVLCSALAHAQYTLQGKIEYEKKVNLYAQMQDGDDDDKQWLDRIKSQIPKFSVSYFDLLFDTSKTLYKPGRETDQTIKIWGSGPAAENIVFSDLHKRTVKASKKIYEQKFLIEDTMRKIDWKMVDEIRMIANYKCKKAVSKICDSVYVVAFYAEDIVADGGPEMMCGLPGMILELAIPRLHTTWTATKVDIAPPLASDFVVPDKGKQVTQKGMYESLQSSFKTWGNWANRYIWWCVL